MLGNHENWPVLVTSISSPPFLQNNTLQLQAVITAWQLLYFLMGLFMDLVYKPTWITVYCRRTNTTLTKSWRKGLHFRPLQKFILSMLHDHPHCVCRKQYFTTTVHPHQQVWLFRVTFEHFIFSIHIVLHINSLCGHWKPLKIAQSLYMLTETNLDA